MKKRSRRKKNFILSRNNPNDNSDDDVITKCDKQHCGTEGSVENGKEGRNSCVLHIYKVAEFSLHIRLLKLYSIR